MSQVAVSKGHGLFTKHSLQFHYFFRCAQQCAEEFLLYSHEQCLALYPDLLNPASSTMTRTSHHCSLCVLYKEGLINRVNPDSSQLRHRNTAVFSVCVGGVMGVLTNSPDLYSISLSFWHVMLVFNLMPA